jgi:ABC-type multidrug transport system fused ATPase/permease subunit
VIFLLYDYLKKIDFGYKIIILFSFITILTAIIELLFIYISIEIIMKPNESYLLALFSKSYYFAMLMLFLLGLTAYLFGIYNNFLIETIIARSSQFAANKLLKKYYDTSYVKILKYDPATLTRIITFDLARISVNFIGGFMNLISRVVTVCVVFFFIGMQSYMTLLVVVICSFVICILNNYFFQIKIINAAEKTSSASEATITYVTQITNAFKEILLNRLSNESIKSIINQIKKQTFNQKRLSQISVTSRLSIQYFSILIVASIIVFLNHQNLWNSDTRDIILQTLAILGLKAAPAVNQGVQNFNKIYGGSVYTKSYLKVISDLEEKRTNKYIDNIKLKGKFLYLEVGKIHSGMGLNIVKDIKLSPGKLNYIVGKSGSGKTTLIDSIGGLWGTYEGSKLGIIHYKSQNVFIGQKLLDNLCLGYKNRSLNKYQLEAIHELNLGYIFNSENINNRTLSGGEKQRIAIIDSLHKDANIFCFDEITSGLDHEMATKLINILRKISKKSLLIIITHSEELITKKDNILYVNKGTISDER